LGWRVRWTTPAWDDVEEAVRFIARDSPRYALIVGSHRLIYRVVSDDEVHIIAFINGARDLNVFLEREQRE